jgi:hypothetical protein
MGEKLMVLVVQNDDPNFPSNRRYFATIFAISYAIFLVVFGAIAFIGDAFVKQHPIPQVSYTCTHDDDLWLKTKNISPTDFLLVHADSRIVLHTVPLHRHPDAHQQGQEGIAAARGTAATLRGANDARRGG